MSENQKLFKLLRENKFEELKQVIDKNTNINIKDGVNYFLFELIQTKNKDIIYFIFKNINNIKFDIIDYDERSLIYYIIKQNNSEILKFFLEFINKNIGTDILNEKDKYGFTNLMYAIIFDHFDIVKILIKFNVNLFINNKNGYNAFFLALQYNRNDILIYLLDQINDFNFTNKFGENLLQSAITFENNKIINILLEKNINLNYQEPENGLTIFHQLIILGKINILKQIRNKKIDINISDYIGQTGIMYALIENNKPLFNYLIKEYESEINYNILNFNGNTLLHLYLFEDQIDFNILELLIKNCNLNIQNNESITVLYILIKKNLIIKYKNLLINKKLNIFIEKDNETLYSLIKSNNEIINIIVESYLNELKNNKDKLKLDWEKKCVLEFEKNKNYCLNKVKDFIINNKKSIPFYHSVKLIIKDGLITNNSQYLGSQIDILFNLLWLKNNTNNLILMLEYPLINNFEVESYYDKIGLDNTYKLDFNNIEIIWVYQKLFFPTYFDPFFKNKKIYAEGNYIIIPIGIINEKGAHANIIFWDLKKNIIERFEPYGSNDVKGFYYNSTQLDDLLESKFKSINSKIKYRRPKDYLPPVSFQLLEIQEDEFKKLSDPNGFCSVWCFWWCFQKINNINVSSDKLVKKLIQLIKLNNLKFKNVIRDFSKKIILLRDKYLSNYNLNINDWINKKYTINEIKDIEKNILNNIV